MDQYHMWCDIKDSHKDLEFAKRVKEWLDSMQGDGLIESWRLSRRKLGLGPGELGQFHVVVETKDMSQLEQAFDRAARRSGDAEKLHRAVYAMITDIKFGLWRDFPDSVRGQE